VKKAAKAVGKERLPRGAGRGRSWAIRLLQQQNRVSSCGRHPAACHGVDAGG
jgi:hypothetical protein